MKRRVLAAGLAAFAIGALVVVAGRGGSGTSGPGTAIRGHTWTGPHGVTERVAAIVQRQRERNRRGGNRPVVVREKPDPVELAADAASQDGEAGGEGAVSAEQAGGEAAAKGEGAVGQKPKPGEPPPPPKASSAPISPQTPRGEAAIGPSSSFSAQTSFIGAQVSDSGFIPPDSMGSVGPDQIVVDVNGRIRVFDKTGTLGGLNVTDAAFWASVDAGSEPTDPGVEYDRLSGHWIISAINTASTNNRVMIAVSSGPHISDKSSFTFFEFAHNAILPGHSGQFADYPQLGVDANAVYIGINDFRGNAPDNSSVFVIKKSSLLTGTLNVTGFQVATLSPQAAATGPSSPQPATDMDPGVPDGYVVGPDAGLFGQLDVLRVSDPGGTPTMSSSLAVPVDPTSFPLNAPAQGTHTTLDALDDRLFEAMIARGPDGSDSLWTAHNIAVDSTGTVPDPVTGADRDGARWYQIGDLGSDPPTLVQSGTLFDPAASSPNYYWMPSIAMNGQGHASLNANVAGVGKFAEVVSSGRLASEAPNTTEDPTTIQTSTSTYDLNPASGFQSNKRWGDYSQTVVDPTDDQTFWTFQEYPNTNNSWAVRVIKLQAPPPATPSLATPGTVDLGQQSVTVQLDGTSTDGSGFFDPESGFPNHISAAVSGGVRVNSVTYVDPTHVTLDLNTTCASEGSQSVTITNPDGQQANGADLLTVGPNPGAPAPPSLFDTVPASPANDHSPFVQGCAQAGSTVTVSLYADDDTCDPAALVGSGTADDFGSTGIQPTNPLPEGETTLYATADDGVNSPSACSSTLSANGSITYLADSTTPVSTIDGGPNGVTADTRPTFSFHASEPSSFECSIDTGTSSFAACSGPGDTDTPALPLADGTYTFRVRATDQAGNTGAPATQDFTVQTPPPPPPTTTTTATTTATIILTPLPTPDTAITKGPKKKTSKRRPKFKFSSSQAGASFQCKLDRGKFARCTSPFRPKKKLRPGKHVLRVKAIGPTGVIDPSPALRKFKVLP